MFSGLKFYAEFEFEIKFEKKNFFNGVTCQNMQKVHK
jgi:hypothetical protein